MEKNYHFEVKIISDCYIPANNERDAIEILKDSWRSENNFDLDDKEIKLIAVEKERKNKNGTLDITIN